jgi:hypothetical protein
LLIRSIPSKTKGAGNPSATVPEITLQISQMTNAALPKLRFSAPTDCNPRLIAKDFYGFHRHIRSEGLHVQSYSRQIGSPCSRAAHILFTSRLAGISRVFRRKFVHKDNGTVIAQATPARVLSRLFVGVEKWITCPLITGPADCTSRTAHLIDIVVVTNHSGSWCN